MAKITGSSPLQRDAVLETERASVLKQVDEVAEKVAQLSLDPSRTQSTSTHSTPATLEGPRFRSKSDSQAQDEGAPQISLRKSASLPGMSSSEEGAVETSPSPESSDHDGSSVSARSRKHSRQNASFIASLEELKLTLPAQASAEEVTSPKKKETGSAREILGMLITNLTVEKPEQVRTAILDTNTIELCADHIAPNQLKALLEKIDAVQLSIPFLVKLHEALRSNDRRGSDIEDHVIDELANRVNQLRLSQKLNLLYGEVGSAFRSYMGASPKNFKKIMPFLLDEGGRLWGCFASQLQSDDARKTQGASAPTAENLLHLFEAVNSRIKYIQNKYSDVIVDNPLEVERLNNLKDWLLDKPEEVLEAILENRGDQMFIGLGEVFFLSSLHYANTKIQAAGSTIAPEVRTLTSLEKVALVTWTTGYYNGINSALRDEDNVGSIAKAFDDAMIKYETTRLKKEVSEQQTLTPLTLAAPQMSTGLPGAHRTLSGAAVSEIIQHLKNGLKKLPDLSATTSDGTRLKLKRVINAPVSADPTKWEAETFSKDKPFSDPGIMSISIGDTAASGWRTLYFENTSEDAPTWPGFKDIMLFSIFGKKESEIVALPGIEFDCLNPYEPDKQGSNFYRLKQRLGA